MSRILRHVGNKDFKRTRQRQVDEQREIAAKKSKELQEAEEERRQIEEIARPYKSNWREETQLQESDWTPVAGSIANSTSQTFEYPGGSTVTVSGLGGVETTPSTVTVNQFGDVFDVPGPNYSQLGLQGYAPPLGNVNRRRDYEDVNPRLDASQEFAQNVNADVFMGARVQPSPALNARAAISASLAFQRDAVLDALASATDLDTAKNALRSYNDFLANPKGAGSSPNNPLDISNQVSDRDMSALRDAANSGAVRSAIDFAKQKNTSLAWNTAADALQAKLNVATTETPGLDNTVKGAGTLDRERFIQSNGEDIRLNKKYAFRPGGSVADFEKSILGKSLSALGVKLDTFGTGGISGIAAPIVAPVMLTNLKGDLYNAPAANMQIKVDMSRPLNTSTPVSGRGAGRSSFPTSDGNVVPRSNSANANSVGQRGSDGGMTDAQIKAAQDRANAARRAGKMSDIRGSQANKGFALDPKTGEPRYTGMNDQQYFDATDKIADKYNKLRAPIERQYAEFSGQQAPESLFNKLNALNNAQTAEEDALRAARAAQENAFNDALQDYNDKQDAANQARQDALDEIDNEEDPYSKLLVELNVKLEKLRREGRLIARYKLLGPGDKGYVDTTNMANAIGYNRVPIYTAAAEEIFKEIDRLQQSQLAWYDARQKRREAAEKADYSDAGGSSGKGGSKGGQGGLPIGSTALRGGAGSSAGARKPTPPENMSQSASLARQAASARMNPQQRRKRGMKESTTWSRLKKYR